MAKRQDKVVTLSEFKAWLEGFEEMQNSTWVPDPKQWKVIRKKINNIVADLPTVAQNNHPQHGNIPHNRALPPGIPPMPLAASSIPSGLVELGETAKAVGMEQTIAPDGSPMLKTPDSSSSDGSQFS